MVQILLDVDALPRGQTDLAPRRDGVGSPVGVNRDVRLVVDGLVRQAVVDADQDIAAAAVDNVFGLVPVEVIR